MLWQGTGAHCHPKTSFFAPERPLFVTFALDDIGSIAAEHCDTGGRPQVMHVLRGISVLGCDKIVPYSFQKVGAVRERGAGAVRSPCGPSAHLCITLAWPL
jgi:hypothetical protein